MVRASREPSFGHARGDCNRAEGLAGRAAARYATPMRTGALLLVLLLGGAAPTAAHPVGVATLALEDAARGRRLVTEVWYPARATGRDAPPRAGRFPLVLVAHGHCGFRTNYQYLTVPLAGEGFVVAAPDFPGFNKAVCDAGAESIGDIAHDPEGDLAFLRAVLHERTGPGARVARHVRGRRAGLVGHSLGGYVVLRAALADPAFSVVAALAPLDVFGHDDFAHLSPRRTFLLAGATGDRTLPYATVTVPLFALLPPRAYLLEIVGGSHSGFTDMDSTLAPAALARQQALVRRYVTALFARWLAHRLGAARTLTPGDAAAQGPDVALTVRLR
jgi:predicted dienelactone hydrolase